MTTPYSTLAEVKAGMAANLTVDDAKTLAFIREVSNRIDRLFYKRRAPLFAPYKETRNTFRLTADRINSAAGTYYFGEPLLELTGVQVGTSTLTLATDVELWQGDGSPYYNLELVPTTRTWYYYIECENCLRLPFVSITGTWGYHPDYENAWLNVDTLQANINASVTSLTVADVDGSNQYGYSPRISAGNLLQIDTEWLEVTATNTGTNAVTVIRGVNGSTAAAHSSSADVAVYQVDDVLRRAIVRQAGLQYAKIGAYEVKKAGDLATFEFPADTLSEFQALLSLFANM